MPWASPLLPDPIRWEEEPYFQLINLSTDYWSDGTVGFFFMAYLGHQDLTLRRIVRVNKREAKAYWYLDLRQTSEATGETKAVVEARYLDEYPTELVRGCLEEEFPSLDPLELELIASDLREQAQAADSFLADTVQTYMKQAARRQYSHAHCQDLLPRWNDDKAMLALQDRLDGLVGPQVPSLGELIHEMTLLSGMTS